MSDIFKKSFLEGYASSDITIVSVVMAMITTAIIGIYIFYLYRVVTRKTFYSKNFNVSLVGVALITAAIIVTIQSSIVVSLGMVGALSIVRFRTAIKDPMDLMFLFWSISAGIICGAGFAEFAIILSLFLTIVILLLNYVPVANAPMILIVNANSTSIENDIITEVKKFDKHFNVKSRNMTSSTFDLTVEIRTDKGADLIKEINSINGIVSVALLSHDGEATF